MKKFTLALVLVLALVCVAGQFVFQQAQREAKLLDAQLAINQIQAEDIGTQAEAIKTQADALLVQAQANAQAMELQGDIIHRQQSSVEVAAYALAGCALVIMVLAIMTTRRRV